MLASEEKLLDNNIACTREYLKALRVVRENGGFGAVETKVKDGLVVVVKAVVEYHVQGT